MTSSRRFNWQRPNRPVLDLLTVLSFDKAHEWLEFCQANHLPSAANFDARIVHRLNAVYAKGITLNHPLYRDYRTQIMKNRVSEAAVTLRSIVRLNPSDQNARQELERLEEKTTRTRFGRTFDACRCG